MDCNCNDSNDAQIYTAHAWLKGMVADYTISDNVIASKCANRNFKGTDPYEEVDKSVLWLTYADLLKYIYLQPSGTKSYAVANGTWSQKEGATRLSEEDKKRILAEMRRIYGMYGEPESVPSVRPTIRMTARGINMWKR